MTDTQLGVRSLFSALILPLFVLCPAKAQESSSHNALSDLHQFRVSNYMALDVHYRFSVAGDTETLNEIVAGINRANGAINSAAEGTSDATPLDVKARQFDTLLADIKSTGSTGELQSTMDSVGSKWQFIRGSYIIFNDTNVAFVIDRYSKAILAGPQITIDLLTGSA